MAYMDTPIQSSQQDLLNRASFATHLGKSLATIKYDGTFTVGLFGTWGSGKTSVVNMALEEVEHLNEQKGDNEKVVVIRFEPWNFTDSAQLINQFFVRMINEFSSSKDKKLQEVSKALKKYSDAFDILTLLPYGGEVIASFSKNAVKRLSKKFEKIDDKDSLKQKDYLIKRLNEQDHRILIVIDDIDRLNNEQIRAVFQLVTAVAKLPNITYLLVFDKDIVTRALKEVQQGDGEEYLEKVIQMPIQIPEIQYADLQKVFFDRLDQIINEYNGIYIENNRWSNIYFQYIKPFITNLRDVWRLCNVLEFKLAAIASEVDFVDLITITTIEIHLPQIFTWIKENKALLTGVSEYPTISFRRSKPEELYQQITEEVSSILGQGHHKMSVKSIIDMVSTLFPHFGNNVGRSSEVFDQATLRRTNRVAVAEKFDRYFQLNPDLISVPTSLISKIKTDAEESEIKRIIKEFDEDGNGWTLIEELRAVKDDIPHDRIKIICNALFATFTSLSSTSSSSIFTTSTKVVAGYFLEELVKLLPKSERLSYLVDVISDENLQLLAPMSIIINRIENSYEEDASSNFVPTGDNLLVLTDLEQLRKKYIDRVRNLKLFEIPMWEYIYFLLKKIDSEFTEKYMKKQLKNAEDIITFLDASINEWTGSGTEYEVGNTYKAHLTENQIMQAIDESVERETFFDLEDDVQRKAAAFYQWYHNESSGRISKADVDALLQNWR